MRWILLVLACGCGTPQKRVLGEITVIGQHDDDGDGTPTNDALRPLRVADYRSKPALAIIIGAQACVPCQNEQPMLVTLYQRDRDRASFLEAIVENAAGAPADQALVDAWATRYGLPFDITADPMGALLPYYDPNSFPTAMVVRTTDLSIVYQATGPADGLAAALDAITR
jgi:hypothetical protein